MARSTTACWVVVALVASVWLWPGAEAKACDPVGPAPSLPPPPTGMSTPTAISLAVPAVIDATFLGLQLGYADQMLPTELAVVQIILGSSQVVYSSIQMTLGVVSGSMSCGGNAHDIQALTIGGLVGTFLGSWLIAHGVASVQVRRHRARQEPTFTPRASVSHEGFVIGLGGSF
ncbi:MAG: hypothetical protein OHK0013_20070 [Sandaracinaceae bacterium]